MTGDTNLKVRDVLGSFLFSSDEVSKKISVLSGGERARVSLCKLLLSPINFLIMDEPTNHLDMISKDILKKALIAFDGTLIIISHDRYFLQGLSNKIYEFKNQNIKEYIGDVNTFLKAKELEDLDDLNIIKTVKLKTNAKKDSEQKLSYQQQKKLDRNIRKTENKIFKLEDEIGKLEERQREIDEKLSNPELFKAITKEKDFFKNYEANKQKIEKKEKEWGALISKLNNLKTP